MHRSVRPALLSLALAVSAAAADAPAGQVLYTGKRQLSLPLSNVGEPATVLKSRLFVTTDGGKSWNLAHEIQVPDGAKELPRFPFSVDRDGAFGIMPCTSYRNGASEPEPKPGQAPPYVLMVDTVAPAITRFDATLMGRAVAKAVVRSSWSVNDAHLDAEPIGIEASVDGGARFITIHRGARDGAAELTVPLAPEARELQLRLVVADRARNVTVSPSRSFSLEPMATPAQEPAPQDPMAALTLAAATLPTLAEVGAGPARPLPTRSIAPPSQVDPLAPVAPPPGTVTEVPAPSAPATPPEHADILVDGKPYVAPVAEPPTAAPELVIADNAVDRAYEQRLAERSAAAAAEPVAQATAAPAPAATAPTAPTDGRRAPPPSRPVRLADEAKTLADARILASLGNLDDACDVYERLYYTSLGRTALYEQVKLLLAQDRPRDAITAISGAPVEVVSDAIRLDHGRILLQLERPAEVEAALAAVRGGGPQSRPALLLLAKAYRALGREQEARRAFEHLARGDDGVAAEARALAGR
jgi:hypothetical protein